MRITVQRRLGLPLDVACQAVEAGKKAPNGKPHEELGDAAMMQVGWWVDPVLLRSPTPRCLRVRFID